MEQAPLPPHRLRSLFAGIDAPQLMALFGFSCYLVWEFMGVYEMVPFLASFFSDSQLHILRACLFGALALLFLVVLLFAPRNKKLFPFFLATGCATALVSLLFGISGMVFGSLSFWLGLIAWISFGVSVASFMLMWALYFELSGSATNPVLIAGAYMAGMTVFLLLSLSKASQEMYLLVGLLLTLSTAATAAFLGKDLFSFKDFTSQKKVKKPSLVALLHASAYGVIYGFVISFLLSLGPVAAPIGAAGALLGCILAIVMLYKNALLDSTRLRRATFAPVVVAILFLPFGGRLGSIACSLLIVATCVSTAVASWIIAPREVAARKLDPIRAFAGGKTPGWISFFLGTLSGTLLMAAAPSLFPLATTILAAGICLTFSAFELSFSEGAAEEAKPASAAEVTRRFQDKCDYLSQKYGLSPREDEVFRLLAKGRNAEHIGSTLCIARPTVKTHIQHVYQKIGINSHQELIDLVDTEEPESASRKQ